MSLNDPLGDALSHILNCEKIGRSECILKPASKVLINVLKILNEAGYVGTFGVIDDGKGKVIKLNLLGRINKCGAIKPRFSVTKDNFEKFEKRFLPARDIGVLLVSTSKGIMIHTKAKEKSYGGKLFAYCY